MPRPHLPVVDYLSTTELGPPAEPLWRATALMNGRGAIGTRGPVSVSFPRHHTMGPPLTPGPWKVVVLIKCSLNLLLIGGELGQGKVMLQLPPPLLCLQVLAMSSDFLLVPALLLALSLTTLGLALILFIVTQTWVSLGRPQRSLRRRDSQ